MGLLDFDLRNFMEDMRACKPPYKCPYPDCAKVYKTFPGIQTHIQGHMDKDKQMREEAAHNNAKDKNGGSRRPPSPIPPFFGSPLKETLVFDEIQKRFEFEAEGNTHMFGVFDALQVRDNLNCLKSPILIGILSLSCS